MKMRKAIALIELIFAMVVIAITLLSVPNLINQTTQASNKAITQEAISNAASYSSMIMSVFWDENSVDPKLGNPILVVDTNTPGLGEKDINKSMGGGLYKILKKGVRVGSSESSKRRYAADTLGNRLQATPPNNLGLDAGDIEPDDIDDYNNTQSTLTLESPTTSKVGDYKDITIRMETEVSYINDAANPNFDNKIITFNNPFNNVINKSTNIKKIKLTLTSNNDPDKKVVLNSFSCNIGSGKLNDRVIP